MSSLTDRSRSRAIALHSDTVVRSPKWLCPRAIALHSDTVVRSPKWEVSSQNPVLVANARACKIAISSVLLLLVITAPVRAQAPAAPRATPHEAARPANAQDMFGWLRQFAPTQRRQSRVVSSPPLPRPRPAELTPTPTGPSPTSEELAPASLEPSQTPTEVAPPDEPNEGPLND